MESSQLPMANLEMRLAAIGGGAWGTTLVTILRRNGHAVTHWSRRCEEPLAEAIAGCRMIFSAVSMRGVTDTIAKLPTLPPETILVSASKGLDAATGLTAAQMWQTAFPHHAIAVLSGPNLSQEILAGLPAATVVASTREETAIAVQRVLAAKNFRVYTNADPLGVELGGTLKNVIAIAVGVCDGINLGANAKAALITRAMAEIVRVGQHQGARAETFWGLSGLGDLLATCNSPLSRNYRVGFGLGQGKSLEQVLAEINETAEGVNTARVLMAIADREGLYLPICRYVCRLLGNEITPLQAVEGLMERDLKSEI